MDGVKTGVTRESKNLYKADTDLHNATVNGDAEKAECSFNRELFWWNLWRLAENVFAQVAHHDDKANDDRENRLKELVSDADQKTRTDKCPKKCRQKELQEYFFVQIAVPSEV